MSKPTILSLTGNVNLPVETNLLTVSIVQANNLITPLLLKVIIEHLDSSSNPIKYLRLDLDDEDFHYSNNEYTIYKPIKLQSLERVLIKASVHWSNGTDSLFSDSFISNASEFPITPVLVSASGTGYTTIAVYIQNDSSINSTYTAFIGYTDYDGDKQLIIEENLTSSNGSVVLTDLSDNLTYTIQLLAVNSFGISEISNSVTASTSANPLSVQNLSVSLHSQGYAILSWSNPLNSDYVPISSFKIYDSENAQLAEVASNIFTWNSDFLLCGSTYSYYVVAMNGNNVGISSTSVSLSVPNLNSVENLTASFDSNGNITISWQPPTNSNIISADSYNVIDIISNDYLIHTNDLTYTLNRAAGQTYSFVVEANHRDQHFSSNPISVSIPLTSAPNSLSYGINITSPPTASIFWTEPNNVNVINTNSYNVYQDGIFILNTVSTFFNSNALVAGQSYTFIVKSLHGIVEGESSTITFTAYQKSDSVLNLSYQPRNNSIKLFWSVPTFFGGATAKYFLITYDSNSTQVSYDANITNYSLLISNLTNGVPKNISVLLVTSPDNIIFVDGLSNSIICTPSGLPIINSISKSSNLLIASVDGNGSSLVSNTIAISFSDRPTYKLVITPSPSVSDGLYYFNIPFDNLVDNAVLAVSNSVGITYQTV